MCCFAALPKVAINDDSTRRALTLNLLGQDGVSVCVCPSPRSIDKAPVWHAVIICLAAPLLPPRPRPLLGFTLTSLISHLKHAHTGLYNYSYSCLPHLHKVTCATSPHPPRGPLRPVLLPPPPPPPPSPPSSTGHPLIPTPLGMPGKLLPLPRHPRPPLPSRAAAKKATALSCIVSASPTGFIAMQGSSTSSKSSSTSTSTSSSSSSSSGRAEAAVNAKGVIIIWPMRRRGEKRLSRH